jgi:hypothetical protein
MTKDSKGPASMAIDRRDFIKLGAGMGALTTTAMNADAALAHGANGHVGSIDCHVHWTPEAYTKAIAQIKVPAGATADDERGGPNPLSYDLEKRIAWMDERGKRPTTYVYPYIACRFFLRV